MEQCWKNDEGGERGRGGGGEGRLNSWIGEGGRRNAVEPIGGAPAGIGWNRRTGWSGNGQ